MDNTSVASCSGRRYTRKAGTAYRRQHLFVALAGPTAAVTREGWPADRLLVESLLLPALRTLLPPLLPRHNLTPRACTGSKGADHDEVAPETQFWAPFLRPRYAHERVITVWQRPSASTSHLTALKVGTLVYQGQGLD